MPFAGSGSAYSRLEVLLKSGSTKHRSRDLTHREHGSGKSSYESHFSWAQVSNSAPHPVRTTCGRNEA
jgi:hypothetical protein